MHYFKIVTKWGVNGGNSVIENYKKLSVIWKQSEKSYLQNLLLRCLPFSIRENSVTKIK